eukprot:367657_1
MLSFLLSSLCVYHISNAQSAECTDITECSYNGLCKNHYCECFPQWKGPHCASLNTIATSKDSGLHSYVNNSRATTWGGGAVYDETSGLYHMVASEIIDSCGMGVWLSNSQIVHASSKTATGKFQRTSPIVEAYFSHEPNIIRALDTGEFVVYFTHIYPPATYKYPCTACYNGTTNFQKCQTKDNHEYGRNWNIPLPTKMIYTKDFLSWSKMIDINISPAPFIDSNMAVYIFSNGSLVGLLRTDGADQAKAPYYVTMATNWKDNTTYSSIPANMPYNCCGEDMFVWYDKRYDVLHCIWHWYNETGDHPLGIHTYSIDGGRNWDGGYNKYPEEYAYDNVVKYTDGSSVIIDTAERPHLIIDPNDGYTPLALTNGAGIGDNDYMYTLLRP